jgi:hypothetical protein
MMLSLSLRSVYPPAHPGGGDPAQDTPESLNPAGVARFRGANRNKIAAWLVAACQQGAEKQGNLEKGAISLSGQLSAGTSGSIIFANG